MTNSETTANHADRILTELLRLHAAGSLSLERGDEAAGVASYRFRCGGWPIVVDLDDTVLEVRAHFGNHTIATGRVREAVMRRLISDAPGGAPQADAARESLAALCGVVGDWRRANPRVFMEPPRVARHPDGWNNT